MEDIWLMLIKGKIDFEQKESNLIAKMIIYCKYQKIVITKLKEHNNYWNDDVKSTPLSVIIKKVGDLIG